MLRYIYFVSVDVLLVKNTLHIKYRVLLSTVVFICVAEDGTMAL